MVADRFVLKQFAGSATNNGAFGAAQATGAGVQPVADIKDVQSLNAFEQGWSAATLTADKLPALEEMQGLEALLCKALKENYSEGIPFWIAGETYFQYSFVNYNGVLYYNTTGSYTNNNPAIDTSNWAQYKPATAGAADTAAVADKLGTATVGTDDTPIYLNTGTPTAGKKVGITAYDNTKTYSLNNVVLNIEYGTVKLYRSFVNNNTSPLTDGTKWKEVSLGGGSHVVGEIVSVFGTDSYAPFGCVLADGTEYTKALFPSVWSDYIKGASVGNAYCWVYNGNINLYTLKSNPSVGDYLYFYTNGILTTRCIVTSVVDANTLTMRNIGINDILTATRNSAGDLSNVSIPLLPTTDYSQYQNEITACGQCAMFAVDSANGTFKVPTIKDGGYLTQALSVGEIGRAYNESLPNHSHTITFDTADLETGNGYIGWEGKGTVRSYSVTSSGANQSTYQDGAPVQGDNVRVRFFVCLAGGVINESMIDWQNYITALSGKANTDLSNVTAAGKSAAVGWGMPDYTVGIDLSGYNSASNKFTAPCDGLIIMCGGGTANNAFNLVIDDEVYLFNNSSTTHWVGQQFFIRKGSNFYYFGTLPEYGARNFFPMEGAQ